jgi:hypothetical protein
VDAAGGRISAADAPGGGAVFSVWLPACAVPHDEATASMRTAGAHG